MHLELREHTRDLKRIALLGQVQHFEGDVLAAWIHIGLRRVKPVGNFVDEISTLNLKR